MKYEIGIDEAGRGPLAGPVAVGVAKVPVDFDWGLIEGVADSKKLSHKKRAVIFARAIELQKQELLDFRVELVSAAIIDTKGIVFAINQAMSQAIKKLQLSTAECFIKLDGSLKAPGQFQQETIIKGDSTEKVIGLASICAKETRDAYMLKKSSQPSFIAYKFAQHKGYGTKAHRAAIIKLGLTVEHRKSYCKGCI